MISGTRGPALLAFMVIGAIISVTNAKPPSRIVGGRDDKLGEHKWVASVRAHNSNLHCGGAIISPRHILTAADCLKGHKAIDIVVFSGVTDLGDIENITLTPAGKLVSHDLFQSNIPNIRPALNDIAIIILTTPLTLGDRMEAIPLPTKEPSKSVASISGWGLINRRTNEETKILQTADVQVLSEEECSEAGGQAKAPQFFCGLIPHGFIYAGDTGSPVSYNGELIGIASTGWAVEGVPDSFTNVYHYVKWINWVMHRGD